MGGYFLRQEEMAGPELAARLQASLAEAPDQPVYVRGDREAPYGLVLRVMGRLAQAGIAHVALIAEAEASGAGAVAH